jgi:hypothetical protein
MGLKGYRLWATGQIDSTCRAPPGARAARCSQPARSAHKLHFLKKQNFETRYRTSEKQSADAILDTRLTRQALDMIGSPRVATRCLQAMGGSTELSLYSPRHRRPIRPHQGRIHDGLRHQQRGGRTALHDRDPAVGHGLDARLRGSHQRQIRGAAVQAAFHSKV